VRALGTRRSPQGEMNLKLTSTDSSKAPVSAERGLGRKHQQPMRATPLIKSPTLAESATRSGRRRVHYLI
jgi:hypothetical protein